MMSSVGPERRVRPRFGGVRSVRPRRSRSPGTLHEVVIQLLSQQDAEARDAEARAEMSRQ